MIRSAICLLLLFCAAGCAPLATFSISDEIDLEVWGMATDEDQMRVEVKFVNKTAYPEVIQEGRAEAGITFVEKFPAQPRSYTDYHTATEMPAPFMRILTVYAGETSGTDPTLAGFAMLPRNMDGSLTTMIPVSFNTSYQREHTISGRIVRRSDVQGDWRLAWAPNEVTVITRDGRITKKNETITVSGSSR